MSPHLLKSFQFFRTIPNALNVLALASIAGLIIKVFLLNHIPEWFRGAYEIGVVFDGLLASVFASYVFYLIVVHGKDLHDKSIISPHINKWAASIVRDCNSQLRSFSKAGDIDLNLETISQETVNSAFSKLGPYSEAPLAVGLNKNANWLQFMQCHNAQTSDHISKILTQLRFLDAQLVALLTAISDCNHFEIIRLFSKFPITNTDLSAFSNQFYDYCVACRSLDTYLKANKF